MRASYLLCQNSVFFPAGKMTTHPRNFSWFLAFWCLALSSLLVTPPSSSKSDRVGKMYRPTWTSKFSHKSRNAAASLSNQVDFWHFSCTLFCRATYKEVYMYMYKTENGKFFANCRRCSKTACNCLHALYIILFCAFNRIKAAASEPWSRAIKKHRDL